jgi:hypothetical protein
MKNFWKKIQKVAILSSLFSSAMTVLFLTGILPTIRLKIPKIELTALASGKIILSQAYIESTTLILCLLLTSLILLLISIKKRKR